MSEIKNETWKMKNEMELMEFEPRSAQKEFGMVTTTPLGTDYCEKI